MNLSSEIGRSSGGRPWRQFNHNSKTNTTTTTTNNTTTNNNSNTGNGMYTCVVRQGAPVEIVDLFEAFEEHIQKHVSYCFVP